MRRTYGAVVYTGGTFDLFHAGHVELLRTCRSLAGRDGRVVVALNTDQFVMDYKHIIPSHDYDARKIILEACQYVDLVVCNTGNEDSKVAIEVVQPDIIAIGADWSPQNGKDYMAQMKFTEQWLNERHIELRFVPLLAGHSATITRRKLASVP